MNVTEMNIGAQLGLVVFVSTVRYLFERLLSRLFKALKVDSTSIQIFTKSIVMIGFNVILLLLFGLLVVDLVTFKNAGQGLVFIVIGLVGALLVSLLSYLAIKAGYGKGYEELLAKSPRDQVLTWITFLILVGPAEDLFFLGFV